jgi:GWxTD domain-containing protein
MNKFSHWLLAFSAGLLLWGCGSSNELSSTNLAHLYQDESFFLKPQFNIHHINDDTTRVFFKIESDQVLYVRNQDGRYEASVKIGYRLLDSYILSQVIDTGTVILTDLVDEPKAKMVKGHFNLSYPIQDEDNRYVLEVTLTDLKRKIQYQDLIDIHKYSAQHRQTFTFTDTAGIMHFNPWIEPGQPFLLKHASGATSYKVRVYTREFPLAAPPHVENRQSTLSYEADSIFTQPAEGPIVLTEPGFYHFQVNDEDKNGFTVYLFGSQYPFVSRKGDLGPPLRYLTTNTEYSQIYLKDDPAQSKKNVDDFWLRRVSTLEQGEELVSTYYGRIETSNRLFTSYVEGWRTDRGIIYTVYGPPSGIYRNSTGETWVYGNENSSLNYVFNFVKVSNPFTENDFALSRLSRYRYGWGQAIEAWRRGSTYNVTDIKREQDERDRQLQYSNQPNFWY